MSTDAHTPEMLTISAPPCPGGEALPPFVGRFEIEGEVGRGGMGLVLRGRDADLGRPVAVKVLLAQHQGNADLERRFVEEARLTGQLEHPGVPAVHELGRLADQRPYFAMRLVRGQTLGELLRARRDCREELARFLTIFEQVCQAVAYAHSKGVIHRDLKPSNIMVGAFGEVQVMDWGLAKVLVPPTSVPAVGSDPEASTVYLPAAEALTHAGSVLGTPAYMAPEQARGEVSLVDERSDVFALGGILCVVLTGEPPYTGAEAFRQAQQADLAGVHARLEACGLDRDLIALARRCLAAAPADRPGHAGELAMAVAQYQQTTRERLAQAERDRAAALVRALEEGKRRRLVVRLAGAVLLLATLAAGGGLWAQHERQQRTLQQEARAVEEAAQAQALREKVEAALGEAGQALADSRWGETAALLAQARRLLGDDGPDDLLQRHAALEAARQLAMRLEAIRLDKMLGGATAELRREQVANAYALAFSEAGLGRFPDSAAGVAQRIRASLISRHLIHALDDWASYSGVVSSTPWLLEVARLADGDPIRNRLRDPNLWARPNDLLRQLEDTPLDRLSPSLATTLGQILLQRGGNPLAFLLRVHRRFPADFWVNFELGNVLGFKQRLHARAVGYYQAALVVRPEAARVWSNYGLVLTSLNPHEAIPVLERAVALLPDADHWSNLGLAYLDSGRLHDAEKAHRRAVALAPHIPDFRNNLASTLSRQGRDDEVEAMYRQLTRDHPRYGEGWGNLGHILLRQKRLREALPCLERAVQFLPRQALFHMHLGITRFLLGQQDEGLKSLREAVRLDGQFALGVFNLGYYLSQARRPAEAVEYLRRATLLAPREASYQHHLGQTLAEVDRPIEAAASFRAAESLGMVSAELALDHAEILVQLRQMAEADKRSQHALRLAPLSARAHQVQARILLERQALERAARHWWAAVKINPDLESVWFHLGRHSFLAGRPLDAICPYRRALTLKPGWPEALCNLGLALRDAGRFREAVAPLRRGHRLGSALKEWRYHSAGWLAEVERLADLQERLEAVLRNTPRPATAEQRYALADFCRLHTTRRALAARLYAEAFAADPLTAGDVVAGHRYQAACMAALAGTGRDADPGIDQPHWRKQALGWLRDDLNAWSRQLPSASPRQRAELVERLRHCQQDSDLSGVRGAGLASLSEEEQRAWRTLWHDVEALRRRAAEPVMSPAGAPR